MRFITSTFFAVAALAGLVMAGENPIIYPDGSSKIVAGSPFVVTWTPTTGGTVTLMLRQGASDNLDDVKVIVAGTENDGTYEWTPEKTLPAGANYAIMITDSKGNVNYTPLISIQSDVAPSVKSSTSAKATSTASAPSSTKIAASATTELSSAASSSAVTSSAAVTSAAVPHSYSNSTMITSAISSYANATSTGNLTRSSSHSSSPTSTDETAATATGAASSLLKSPLALVVCVLGAVLYLN